MFYKLCLIIFSRYSSIKGSIYAQQDFLLKEFGNLVRANVKNPNSETLSNLTIFISDARKITSGFSPAGEVLEKAGLQKIVQALVRNFSFLPYLHCNLSKFNQRFLDIIKKTTYNLNTA